MNHRIYNIINRFKGVILISALALAIGPFTANAQLQVPAIPSNTQLSNQYEYSSEYIYRINLSGGWLEDGTIIAYVDGELRGAQSASLLFPPTGLFEYKVRVFSNSSSGDSVSFKYYDVFNGKVYEIEEKEYFTADNVPDYYSPTTLNAYCGDPGQATGLLPGDGSTGLEATVDFFWEPSGNTLHYNLFLWKDGESVPGTPYRSNIYGSSARIYNLEYSSTYHWFIQSLNQCKQVNSPTQSLSIRELPDLLMTGVTGPDTVFSATDFEVDFTVLNQGPGSVSGGSWYDAFYLSSDNTLSGEDRLLGQLERSQVLKADSSYESSITLTIPTDYAGNFYLIGTTDRGNRIPEEDNANNNFSPAPAIHVIAKPLPDVQVTGIAADRINYQPGDTIEVSWMVRNPGDADASGRWTEKVSIVSLSGIRLDLSGTPSFNGLLEQGGELNRTHSFIIPQIVNFSGEAYVEVALFPSAELLEYPDKLANNKATSVNRITLQSKLVLNVPASASEDYTGLVRCYVSRSGNYNQTLTVNLTASPANQLNLPASVSIPERSSTAVFNITMIDNDELDGSRNVTVQASASGFDSQSTNMEVLDNEKPTLSLSLDKILANEGETLVLTVSRDLVTADSVVVLLSTDKSAQWDFPDQLTIFANMPSAEVEVKVAENEEPELDEEVSITGRADGVSSGSVSATIIDDDIPEIELAIFADTVSEGAGPYATIGLIRRLGPAGNRIRVNLSADLSNTLYFPGSITLDANVVEKQFNIGAVDNGEVDGNRTVTITGSIYISSCNCNTTASNGGVVTEKLTVADNDGPSLTVTINPVTLKEGLTDAGTMTIFRNTVPTGTLTLSLSSGDDSEVILPAEATIPDGEKSVTVSISTLDDGIDDGSQMVTLQAGAAGFSPGFAWVSVTDINRPDLEISDLELAEDTLVTGRVMEVQALIQNNGFGKAPSGIEIRFYLSKDQRIDDKDSLVFEGYLPEPIPVGDSYQFLDLIPVPPMTGDYFLLGKVNPDATATELLYINNESTPVPVFIRPSYTGNATVAEDFFMSPEPVSISGEATKINGDPAPNVDLDVYVIVDGVKRILEVTTDETGKFTAIFEPYSL